MYKRQLARALGADEVVPYRERDVVAAVREWSAGEGVDAVIDPVGGETLAASLESLRPRGVVVNLGLAGGATSTIPHLYPLFRNERRLVGSWMGSMAELRFGLELVRAGRIRAALDRVLPLEDARVVHEQVADGRIVGKVVLRP